jgi:hypothetical protein
MSGRELRQFLLFVFVLLVPCFALWSFLGAALITPVIGLVTAADCGDNEPVETTSWSTR